MLYKNTITEECWHLLEEIMALDFLMPFCLVGGTALSLQDGHRISDDIDLFSAHPFDIPTLEFQLKHHFGSQALSYLKTFPFGIFCYIHNIKVDLMYWGEGFIEEALNMEGVRIASQKDILAMKLEAIANRASKKDFFDLALLLSKFSLQDGFQFYQKRYPYNDPVAVVKNITNFENADSQPDPILLSSPTWEEVKIRVTNAFDDFFNELQHS